VQFRKFGSTTNGLEQWIAFEPGETGKPRVGGGPQPAHRIIHLAELGVCGAEAVSHVMIAVVSRQESDEPPAGGAPAASMLASAAPDRIAVDAEGCVESDSSIVRPRSALPE
jgi:hypothetical protein